MAGIHTQQYLYYSYYQQQPENVPYSFNLLFALRRFNITVMMLHNAGVQFRLVSFVQVLYIIFAMMVL